MITFIYRSIRVPGVAFALAVCHASAYASDNVLLDAALHAQVDEAHPDRAQLGSYPEIDRWNIHRGLAPAEIDVSVRVEVGVDTSLQVDVVPVVGLTRWAETEGITDLALMQASSVELPVHLQRVETVLNDQDHIVFRGIPIKEIMDHYSSKRMWARTLVFRLGLAPVEGETDIRNNVFQLELTLDPPD